jgi:hypothetical protein
MGTIAVTTYQGNFELMELPFSHSPIGKAEEHKTESIISEPTVEIFPNPSQGQFQIRCRQFQEGSLEIALFNISGQFIQHVYSSVQQPAGDFETTVSLDNASSGIYFIRAVIDGELIAKRVVLIR